MTDRQLLYYLACFFIEEFENDPIMVGEYLQNSSIDPDVFIEAVKSKLAMPFPGGVVR